MADYEITEHPETGAPLVDWAGGKHGLGLKPKNLSAHVNRYPPLASKFPLIPQASWTEQDFRWAAVPVLDQGRTSACLPHSVVEAMGLGYKLTEDEKPILSPWFVYGAINGGRDEGSSLPDALHEAEVTGVPLDSSVKHGAMFGPYSAAAKEEAKRFRIEAAYDAPTLADICSALERPGHIPVIGIDIGADFQSDGDGFLHPFRRSPEGILGHAITVVGKTFAKGLWWPMIQNHWTRQWELDGFAYLHPSYIAPQFGAWALRTLRMDPLDPTPAPEAV